MSAAMGLSRELEFAAAEAARCEEFVAAGRRILAQYAAIRACGFLALANVRDPELPPVALGVSEALQKAFTPRRRPKRPRKSKGEG